MDDDDENSGGRSANWISSFRSTAHGSSLEFTAYNPSPLPPALVPIAERSTLLDVFGYVKRTNSFRDPPPSQLTLKQQAGCHLRTARLILLHQPDNRHPLMACVRLDGTLKPANVRFDELVFYVEDTFPQQRTKLAKAMQGSKLRVVDENTLTDWMGYDSRHTEVMEMYGMRKAEQRGRTEKRTVNRAGEKSRNADAIRRTKET